MLTDFTGADRVIIACGRTDLRLGIDGLAALVKRQFRLDPFTNTLFLFCGRRKDRIKALYWEGNGFVLLYKRLESGSFRWPRNEREARSLTPQQYLTNYLKDGRLELSNNRAERSIKPFVISRKNFLFANTPKGATGSAVMFSLIQTAIENSLDPCKYLTWLMKMVNKADLTDEQIVQPLLPWNAPAECKNRSKE